MIVHWLFPINRVVIILLTVLMPSSVAVSRYRLLRNPAVSAHQVALPLFMILGILFFGPLAIAIGAIPQGGTLLQSVHLHELWMIWRYFPVTTFLMSTYSGSLGGVVLAALFLLASVGLPALRRKKLNDL